MKAAQYTRYNKQETVLIMAEIETPTVAPNQVLIKVTAAGVNHLDNLISHGDVKMIVPLQMPHTAGNEVVGIVEKVGSQVGDLKIGERVFGRLPLDSIGTFAEYVAVDRAALAKVPDYLSDMEAATIPMGALVIMQALELMGATAGKILFISGGTGGVGSLAIPLAKAKGLTVITSGSAKHADRVLALGADRFIDYKTEDYSKALKDVDYVLDTVGGKETEKQMSILKKGGHLVSLAAMPNGAFAKRINLAKWKQVLFGLIGSGFDKKAAKYGIHYDFQFTQSNGAQLQEVADILASLQFKPAIGSIYPFEKVNTALSDLAQGRTGGKAVLTFDK